ncbi:MAG: protein kinase [Cyanobacteriota bacterium]|nr:protein kinase [Cyanobacteriota bacterium]
MGSSDTSNPWLGRMVGDNQRYRLDKRLGGGGMGEVFVAMDTRVGQEVALKLLKDTLVASSEMRKRFEREIAVCAALQSDHIVKIMDCGFTDEGYPFYVMEYLRGQTLRQLILREKRLSLKRTQAIISQVCKGLQLAHQGVILQQEGGARIKVIHRDLKPDNIFLIPTNLGEWVKVLDFGLAKVKNQSVEQTNLTTTFIGTFRYAAPEQLQNDENLDERADIYSLGLLIYEMLCGVDPFGLSAKGSKVSETSWVLAHAHETPLPLHSSLPQSNGEYVSPQLEAVVMKCLRKKPGERFANVGELNQALQIAVQSQTGNISSKDIPNTVIAQPLQNRGSSDETVARIIHQPQPLQNRGSSDETVARIIHQPQPLQNRGSNDETISRVIQPNEQGNSATPPLSGKTQFQPRPSENNSATPPLSGKTQFQPRPSENNSATPPLSGQTQFQPRPSENNSATPPLSGKTQFQPRNSENNSATPLSGKTQFQPRNSESNSATPALSGQTQFQPRNSQSNSGEPSTTITETPLESNQNKQLASTETNSFYSHLWKIIGVILIFGTSFAIGMNFTPQSPTPENNQNNLENSN